MIRNVRYSYHLTVGSKLPGRVIRTPLKELLIATILAPMLEAVEYYEVDWANEFHQESIYRGFPTPKLELAWDRLWRRKYYSRF